MKRLHHFVVARQLVLYAIEFMRYIHECKIALLGEMGEQPETPAITQPIHKHDTIFNNAKPEEFIRTPCQHSESLNHSEVSTVTGMLGMTKSL